MSVRGRSRLNKDGAVITARRVSKASWSFLRSLSVSFGRVVKRKKKTNKKKRESSRVNSTSYISALSTPLRAIFSFLGVAVLKLERKRERERKREKKRERVKEI